MPRNKRDKPKARPPRRAGKADARFTAAAGAHASKANAGPDDLRRTLAKSRISLELLEAARESKRSGITMAPAIAPAIDVIIEFNRDFHGGMAGARTLLLLAFSNFSNSSAPFGVQSPVQASDVASLATCFGQGDEIHVAKSQMTDNYAFGALTLATMEKLARWYLTIGATDQKREVHLIHKIWKDHVLERCVFESRRTVKSDAAIKSFDATGVDIVWAVADTGIEGSHHHFAELKTLELKSPLSHYDFTAPASSPPDELRDGALKDGVGHGTHVAGIIAGITLPKDTYEIRIKYDRQGSDDATQSDVQTHKTEISGIAPRCKLLSLKVMKGGNDGSESNLILALQYIQRLNDNGRHIKVHGVNLSVCYPFNPKWYAAGQSPLCAEVDRLVRSGVCVVIAAGNAGYGTVRNVEGQALEAAHLSSIADPGNAALAITVGSTHRDMPHTYGISYFSSKGPTADGRMKPDLVAPGEAIVSCALMSDEFVSADRPNIVCVPYKVDSGTSMAAPHVSGALAAFLSVRREFIGRPETVKDILLKSATGLGRRSEFQGSGLLDLMRMLQTV